MTGQPLSPAARAATWLRLIANRAGLDIARDPFRHRVVHALHAAGVDCVLDVGANTGQFGAQLRRAGFRGRIHSVEPLREAYARLERRAARDGRWSTERAAVSDAPGTIRLNVAGNSVSSSVLPMLDAHAAAAPQARYIGTEEAPATTVDAIVAASGLRPESTLVKIDVQGYEQRVLAGAALTLDRFAAVRLELSLVPLYEGQALLPELVELLAKRGLELWHLESGFTEPGTRRLLQCDGLFLRTAGTAP